MKYFGKILLGIALLSGAFLQAEEPYEMDWVEQFGTSSPDYGSSMITDNNGNLYVIGSTYGTFEGEESSGGDDAFIAKYDSEGNQIWLEQFGTSSNDSGRSITTDNNGNLYVTGVTTGEFEGETSNSIDYDVFIAKYDSEGNQIWVEQFGTSAREGVDSITTDDNGNLYVTGYTIGAFNGETSSVDSDAFIAKYDSEGNQIWLEQFGTSSNDSGDSIITDNSGNLYVTGDTSGAFEGEESSGGKDVFIAEYDSEGNQIWLEQFGTSSNDNVDSITTDDNGNLYVTGYTDGAFEGEENSGDYDVYIAKYDSEEGNLIWLDQFGTSGYDRGDSIITDNSGNLYVTGRTTGTFEGETSSGGYYDAFITKYDSEGNPIWLEQFGTSASDTGRSITTDNNGNLYVTGSTDGEFDGETSSGHSDVYIAKFLAPVDPSETINEAIDVIDAMPDNSFSNRNLRKALINKLNAILAMVDNGEYEEALEKLQFDILPKVDGCTLRGEPDRQDWIIDCDEQREIYVLVKKIISGIEALL